MIRVELPTNHARLLRLLALDARNGDDLGHAYDPTTLSRMLDEIDELIVDGIAARNLGRPAA